MRVTKIFFFKVVMEDVLSLDGLTQVSECFNSSLYSNQLTKLTAWMCLKW